MVIIVEAIEEGRIVRVPEDYAIREGLLILRRPHSTSLVDSSIKTKCVDGRDERQRKPGFLGFDDFRKSLKSGENELMKEMIDNFHWLIVQKRKTRGLTRKQVAEAIGETENNLKLIENGVLPANNFILVNKLENYYNLSLRKSGKPVSPMATKPADGMEFRGFNAIKKEKVEQKEDANEQRTETLSGDDLLIETED